MAGRLRTSDQGGSIESTTDCSHHATNGLALMSSPGLARLHLVRNTCRACESADLQPVLSYGDMPRPDTLLTPSQLLDLEPRHDLDLVICDNCSLLQVTQTV